MGRVSTGIKELDKALGGGFLEGQLILVAGNPGCGKTTFGTQFLYSGLKKGEPAIFVGFVEPEEDYMNYMKELGFNLRKYEERGKFRFIEALTVTSPDALEALVRKILRTASEMNAKRLVIDSITAIEPIFEKTSQVRAFLHNVILRALKVAGLTSIIIADLPFGARSIGSGFEEFVFDGVISLESEIKLRSPKRTLVIRKLRGTSLPNFHFDFVITDKGIKIIETLTTALKGSLGEKVSSFGIKEIDRMVGGGLRKGSTSVLQGQVGSGKTMIALKFALESLRDGGKCIYISLEESEEQVRYYLNMMEASEEEIENVKVVSIGPAQYTPTKFYLEFNELVRKYKPNRVVIDGITALKHVYSEEDFGFIVRSIIGLCKENEITLLMTMIGEPLEYEPAVSSLVDNVLITTIERKGDRFVRRVGVSKARGSWTSQVLRILIFEKGGKIVVKE
jgi:circadian clock protein KaiC